MMSLLFRRSVGQIPRFAPIARAGLYQAARFNSSISNKITESALPFTFSKGPVITKYTTDHEWVTIHPDGTSFVGITAYAADALGDATFIELPEVNDTVEFNDAIGGVESVKSASEIYSPVEGEIVAVNTELAEKPSIINQDPMGAGWLAQIKLSTSVEDAGSKLLSEEQYEELLKEDE